MMAAATELRPRSSAICNAVSPVLVRAFTSVKLLCLRMTRQPSALSQCAAVCKAISPSLAFALASVKLLYSLTSPVVADNSNGSVIASRPGSL